MRMIFLVLAVMFSFAANAGFEGLNQGTSLKLFDGLDCKAGLTCIREKNKLLVFVTGQGALEPQVVATATTITSAQCGSTFINSGAVVINLPKSGAGLIGCKLTFITANASNFDVNPNDADQILVQTNALGDAIRNATLGNSITIQAISATQWAPIAVVGTWTDID